jgi:putative nucleotidyltransferase with HDIG domain
MKEQSGVRKSSPEFSDSSNTKNLKTGSKPRTSEMNIPTEQECILLMEEHNLPDNMKRHSVLVTKMADAIGKALLESGEKINLALLHSSALLHDMDKMITLNDGKNHGFLAEKILEGRGFPEVAKIVRKHRLETVFEDSEGLSTWEEKIVYYADKRANDDKAVSIDERYEYLLWRYGINEEKKRRILSTKQPLENLEREIFSKLKIKPEELKHLILTK